jgi:hypothetical protein
MTTLMAKAAEMADVVLIQEPPVRWVPDEAGGVEQRDERSGERRVRERYERWRRGGGCEGRTAGRGDRETRFEHSRDVTVKELTDRAVREGRRPDLVGIGRSESVTITSSGCVQMDRQGLDLSLELREVLAGEITVDCGTVISSPSNYCLTLGQQLDYSTATIGIRWQRLTISMNSRMPTPGLWPVI